MLHKAIIPADNHVLHSWEVANAAARTALVVTAADVGKVAWQQDNNTWWILRDEDPATWVEITTSVPAISLGDLTDLDLTGAVAGKRLQYNGTDWVVVDATNGIDTDDLAEGSTNLYHTAARVLATVLAGFSTASSAVVDAADTVLSALGKLQAQMALRATLASPTFTGTPLAPTAAVNTNTAQLATTAFVVGQAASSTSPMNGTAAVGTSLRYARQDHVHASDTTRAPLASPTFTGVPAAPTATAGTNTTQLATTAFVAALGSLKLNLTGGTLTGDLLISKGTPVLTLNASASGQTIGYVFSVGGLSRWRFRSTATAETGGNTGSNFVIDRYDDAGNYVESALQITRSSGSVSTPNSFIAPLFIGAVTGAASLNVLKAGDTMTGALNEAAATNIASAATVNLTTATGNTVHITGNTTITAITLANGARRQVIFDGSLTLTHGANLQLPGEANIQTRAGDRMIIVADNAGVDYVMAYVRADGTDINTGTLPSQTPRNLDLGTMAYVSQEWFDGSVAGIAGGIVAGTPQTVDITIPGLRAGDFILGVSMSINTPADLELSWHITADDTLTVRYISLTGTVTPGAHTLFARGMKYLPS